MANSVSVDGLKRSKPVVVPPPDYSGPTDITKAAGLGVDAATRKISSAALNLIAFNEHGVIGGTAFVIEKNGMQQLVTDMHVTNSSLQQDGKVHAKGSAGIAMDGKYYFLIADSKGNIGFARHLGFNGSGVTVGDGSDPKDVNYMRGKDVATLEFVDPKSSEFAKLSARADVKDMMERIRQHPNAAGLNVSLNGKLEYKPFDYKDVFSEHAPDTGFALAAGYPDGPFKLKVSQVLGYDHLHRDGENPTGKPAVIRTKSLTIGEGGNDVAKGYSGGPLVALKPGGDIQLMGVVRSGWTIGYTEVSNHNTIGAVKGALDAAFAVREEFTGKDMFGLSGMDTRPPPGKDEWRGVDPADRRPAPLR